MATECDRVGYTVDAPIPDGYRYSHCDCCGDCCCWIGLSGFQCQEQCCPHPTGIVLRAGGADFYDPVTPDHRNLNWFQNDDWRQVPRGYATVSGFPGALSEYGGGQIYLGIVSIVDDSGIEFMSEYTPANHVNDVFTHGSYYRLQIDAGFGRGEKICGGPDEDEYPKRPHDWISGWRNVMWDDPIKLDADGVTQERSTPTPWTDLTIAQTQNILGYTTTSTEWWAGFTNSTFTPVLGATTTGAITTVLHPTNNPTVTPAANTFDYDAWAWRITPAHTTQTSFNVTSVVYETNLAETEKTRDTLTPVYETRPVVVWSRYPEWDQTTTTSQPDYLAGYDWPQYREQVGDMSATRISGRAGDFYYEPYIAGKLTRMESQNGFALPHKEYLFCTDGNGNFKRLGSGSATSDNGFTVGYPYWLISWPRGTLGADPLPTDWNASFKAYYPMIYRPDESECIHIAEGYYGQAELMGSPIDSFLATPDDWCQIDYRTGEIEGAPGNEDGHWVHDRRRIHNFITGFPTYQQGPAAQQWRHPTNYIGYSQNVAELGTYWPVDFHGCYQIELGGGPRWRGEGCDHGKEYPDWPISLRPSGFRLRFAREVSNIKCEYWYMSEAEKEDCRRYDDGYSIQSQRTDLEAVNNYIFNQLGGDWRLARVNEILTDFTPPPHECRVVMTHEKVDNDGNLVLTPYLGIDRATHEGRKDDTNSQWKYLSLPATGYSRYHSTSWDGTTTDSWDSQTGVGVSGYAQDFQAQMPYADGLNHVVRGFEGCGDWVMGRAYDWWDYRAGTIPESRMIEKYEHNVDGNYGYGGGYEWTALTTVQTTTIVGGQYSRTTAVTTAEGANPVIVYENTLTSAPPYTYWETANDYGGGPGYTYTWQTSRSTPRAPGEMMLTPAETYPTDGGQPGSMTTTSDGQGNLFPTPLPAHTTNVPKYESTYTISYTYGAMRTAIEVGQKVTPTFAGYSGRVTAQHAKGTLTRLTNKETYWYDYAQTDTIVDDRISGLYKDIGLFQGNYVTRRWSPWCVMTRGCGHEDIPEDLEAQGNMELFGTPFEKFRPCTSCNEGAYQTGSIGDELGEHHLNDVHNGYGIGESPSWLQCATFRYDAWGWVNSNYAYYDGLSLGDYRWKGQHPMEKEAEQAGEGVLVGSDATWWWQHDIMSEQAAKDLVKIYQLGLEDYVKDSVPDLIIEPYDGAGYTDSWWFYTCASTRLGPTPEFPNKNDLWNDPLIFNGEGTDFGWIDNPEGFFNVPHALYNESRCCHTGEFDTPTGIKTGLMPTETGVWPTGDYTHIGNTGTPCLNYYNEEKEKCYYTVNKEIDLGCDSGHFWGVVDGGAYWDDVLQTGFLDTEMSGDNNQNYSLGFGLIYEGQEITGNTNDGDSRYLKGFIKTGCCEDTGKATITATYEVNKGYSAPHGRMMVTCPDRTGDPDCFSDNYIVDENTFPNGVDGGVWGTGGKTYIMGMGGTSCTPCITGSGNCVTGEVGGEEEEEAVAVSFNIYKPIWSNRTVPPSAGWPSRGTAENGAYSGGLGHSQLGTWSGNGFQSWTFYTKTGQNAGIANYSNGTNSIDSAVIDYQNVLYESDPNPVYDAGNTAAADLLKLSEQDGVGADLIEAIDAGFAWYSLTSTPPYIPIQLNTYQDVNEKNIYVQSIGGFSSPYQTGV